MVMTDDPLFIEEVTNSGNGTISSVYNLVFERMGLPESLVVASFNRQAIILEQSDYPACTPYRFKTKERAGKFLFSEPVYFMLHYKLYQQASLPRLPDTVLCKNRKLRSLKAIIEHQPQAQFVIIPTNSYGDELDKQIAQLPSSSTISWSGTVPHDILSELFFYERGDYALMFPSEVHAHKELNTSATYRVYEMEGLEPYTLGYMMCNQHPESQVYLDKLNATVRSLYAHPDYLQAHLEPYAEYEHAQIRHILETTLIEAKAE